MCPYVNVDAEPKAMYAVLPKPVWSLLFAVFLAAFSVTSGLLLGGDRSFTIRLAFAVCGCIVVHTGRVGGAFYAARCGLRSWHDLCVRKRLHGWACGMFVLSSLMALLALPFLQARHMARIAGVGGELKVYGLALSEYAEANNGTLPPHTDRKRIDAYLASHRRHISPASTTKFGKPFVWCNALGGLRLNDIEKPDEVIVAYACEPAGSYGYAVLYLDGHVKHLRQNRLREQLREREALLAPAIQAQMKRHAAALKSGVDGGL